MVTSLTRKRSKTEQEDICPTCEKRNQLSIKKITDKVPYKKKVLIIRNIKITVCGHCGEEFYTAVQFRHLSRQINSAVRKYEKLLKPEEIKQIRLQTKLSQQKLSKKLGLSTKSFAKWESNQDVQSIQMDNLLRAIRRDPSLVTYLATIRNKAA